MEKKKKDGKSLNCVIDREVYQMLEAYCEDLGQTKTLAVERIPKQHISDHYGHSKPNIIHSDLQ